jgi:hypothetical protein
MRPAMLNFKQIFVSFIVALALALSVVAQPSITED